MNDSSIDSSAFYGLVDEAAQAAVGAGKTLELQKLIQDKSRETVQSQKFRNVLLASIREHLSRLRKEEVPLLSNFPAKFAAVIRRISVFALSRSVDDSEMAALISPELDSVQGDPDVIMEFSSVVLRRIAKIIQERES